MNNRTFAISALWLTVLLPAASRADDSAPAILEQMRAVYSALSSYSDTGTVIYDYTPTAHSETRFTTAFNRSPRRLLIDVRPVTGDRIVITADPDALHTWWKTTGQALDYPNPNNTNALTLTEYPTSAVSTKIPPLLYRKAALPGSFANLVVERDAGIEPCDDKKCHRLEGRTSDFYGKSGNEVNVRKATVWIEVDTYLVRKIVEDGDHPPGTLNRRTTSFKPQANPKLPDDAFKFTPPK